MSVTGTSSGIPQPGIEVHDDVDADPQPTIEGGGGAPEAESSGATPSAPVPAAGPPTTVVYENRRCRVELAEDLGYRVVRSADGHVVSTHAPGEQGYFKACRSADQTAGPPRRPRS